MSIYDYAPFDPLKPEDVLPTKPDSYGVSSRGVGKTPQIRNTPAVNEHVARMLIKYNMDSDAVVSAMIEFAMVDDSEEISESQIRMLAKTIEQRPQVKRYLQDILGQLGLTADSQKLAVAAIWEVVLDKKSKHWPAGVKLLAELGGWVKKTDESDKPVTLVLKGFEKDLETLFDGKIPQPDAMPKKRPIIEAGSDEENDIVQ